MVSRKQQHKIDAQLAARRLARRRWLTGLVVVMLVAGLGWYARGMLSVDVQQIRVEGDLSTSERSAVSAVITPILERSRTLGAGLDASALVEVQDAVAGLSWIDRVSARLRWPDTLIVRLTRHAVVARWGGGGFVATNGEVIAAEAGVGKEASVDALAAGADLPLLDCKAASSARAMSVFSLLNSGVLRADLKLVALRESELGEWTAGIALPGTDRTLDVVLGRDDLAARLRRFVVVHGSELQTRLPQVASIDARYHNGVAVRWKDTPEVEDH